MRHFMKKALTLAAICVLACTVLLTGCDGIGDGEGSTPDTAPAPVPSEGLAFTSNGDGTCYVSGIGDCTDTDVVIPSVSPNGDSVTGIGHGAFAGCSSLVFNEYDNAKYLGTASNPFAWLIKAQNAQITSCAIHEGTVGLEDSAFFGCSSLTSITIPDSVTSIGFGAFTSCSSLTSITIPDSVTSIGDRAFANCSSLADITFTGTKAQWEAIEKGEEWIDIIGTYTVHCIDGDIAK